jgi:hypothetical protein
VTLRRSSPKKLLPQVAKLLQWKYVGSAGLSSVTLQSFREKKEKKSQRKSKNFDLCFDKVEQSKSKYISQSQRSK